MRILEMSKSGIAFALIISLSLFSLQRSYAQLVDKTPAAIPNAPSIYNAEPWQNPQIQYSCS